MNFLGCELGGRIVVCFCCKQHPELRGHVKVSTSELLVSNLRQDYLVRHDRSQGHMRGASLNTTAFIPQVGQILKSPKCVTYSQKNTTVQSPCMNLMPRTCMRGGCALSPRATVFRRVPNDETWRHSSERSLMRLREKSKRIFPLPRNNASLYRLKCTVGLAH